MYMNNNDNCTNALKKVRSGGYKNRSEGRLYFTCHNE